jgi:hypothetical protein
MYRRLAPRLSRGERIHACIQALDRKDAEPDADSRRLLRATLVSREQRGKQRNRAKGRSTTRQFRLAAQEERRAASALAIAAPATGTRKRRKAMAVTAMRPHRAGTRGPRPAPGQCRKSFSEFRVNARVCPARYPPPRRLEIRPRPTPSRSPARARVPRTPLAEEINPFPCDVLAALRLPSSDNATGRSSKCCPSLRAQEPSPGTRKRPR